LLAYHGIRSRGFFPRSGRERGIGRDCILSALRCGDESDENGEPRTTWQARHIDSFSSILLNHPCSFLLSPSGSSFHQSKLFIVRFRFTARFLLFYRSSFFL
ncbi:hypothetical protein PENTCL1PPCAC_19884, partial [Pristionchus entomophagus]